MASSVEGAASAGLSARGNRSAFDNSSSQEYQVILPHLPSGPSALNTIFLHADVKGRPYKVEDFRDTLVRLELLPEVIALGAYQMNHVWAVTFKDPSGAKKLVAASELQVKGRRCLIIDPGNQDVRFKLHWVLHHVPDDEVRRALGPYGKVDGSSQRPLARAGLHRASLDNASGDPSTQGRRKRRRHPAPGTSSWRERACRRARTRAALPALSPERPHST